MARVGLAGALCLDWTRMEPFYTTDRATLYHGDCLAVLPGLAADSVDLVLSDWPYGTTASPWDSVIALEPLWKELKRVCKPNAAIVLTAAQPFTSTLIMSNREWFRYCWVWEKPVGTRFLDAKRRPLACHEDVCVFYAGQPTYHPQKTRGAINHAKGRGKWRGIYRGEYHAVPSDVSGQKYPRTVIQFAKYATTETLHPNQKPVELGAYFVRTYSNPGDVVLDNTCGVGSFIVAAVEEGRRAIGIERAPDPTTPDDYCAIARDRVVAAEAARGYVVPTEATRKPLQLGLAWEGVVWNH